jgi:hypothetical protein
MAIGSEMGKIITAFRKIGEIENNDNRKRLI